MVASAKTIPRRQAGAATLVTALALIFAVSLLSLAVAHTGQIEQRISRNEQLALETRQAAESGLSFTQQWLLTQRPSWIKTPTGFVATPSSPPTLTAANGDSLAINITLETRSRNDRFILLHSDAQPAHSREHRVTVSQYLKPVSVLTTRGERAPPLVIDGCLPRVSGRPRITPAYGIASPTALMSSRRSSCLQTQSIQLNGGTIAEQAFPGGELWPTLIGVSHDRFRKLAGQEQARKLPDSQRNYWWATAADLPGGRWRKDLGSPARPVIIVIPEALGCPDFGGGATIHGLLLIEAPCNQPGAWGHFSLYGVLAVNGPLSRLSRNVRLSHISQAAGQPPRLLPPVLAALPVPGTWSDR